MVGNRLDEKLSFMFRIFQVAEAVAGMNHEAIELCAQAGQSHTWRMSRFQHPVALGSISNDRIVPFDHEATRRTLK